MRVLAPPVLSQLVLTTTSGFLVVNTRETFFGFFGLLILLRFEWYITLSCRYIPLPIAQVFRRKPHLVVFVVNGKNNFFHGFSLVLWMLSFKSLMRVLAPPVLSQLVLTTTSCFLVVSPRENFLGFSDSLFYYDSNGISLFLVGTFLF